MACNGLQALTPGATQGRFIAYLHFTSKIHSRFGQLGGFSVIPRWFLAPKKHHRLRGRVTWQENRDVADAIAMLAKHLEIDPREVRFNGLKDRRSISYQHVTGQAICGRFRAWGYHGGDLVHQTYPLVTV